MKLYYFQELDRDNEVREFYIMDLDLVVLELDMDGNRLNDYDSLRDFYKACVPQAHSAKEARKFFYDNYSLTRVL